MAFCAQCGTQLKEGAMFCGKCGTKIAASGSNQNMQPNTGATVESRQSNVSSPAQGTVGAIDDNVLVEFKITSMSINVFDANGKSLSTKKVFNRSIASEILIFILCLCFGLGVFFIHFFIKVQVCKNSITFIRLALWCIPTKGKITINGNDIASVEWNKFAAIISKHSHEKYVFAVPKKQKEKIERILHDMTVRT
jgi:hypothetical protein